MTKPVCGVCGADDMRLRYPRAPDYITGDLFQVWCCGACGCGQTQPSPTNLDSYYPDRYRQYSAVIAAILRILYRRRVGQWVKLFASPGAAFEMGCGDGLMLAMLRQRGWRVSGSERTESAALIAREQYNLEVGAGGLEAMDPARRFDLVLLNQVLEHLGDPAGTVAMLAGRLAPNGKLIVGVPNLASWQARFGGATWFHLDAPRHLYHFSLPSLTTLMRDHGLEIESVSYVSPEHDPYGWVQSALNLIDRRHNRLTRLLMGIDPPNSVNLLHLGIGCLLGVLAAPVSIVSWIARRGALIEVVCRQGERPITNVAS
jgi:SAM-dependent methyltransferase